MGFLWCFLLTGSVGIVCFLAIQIWLVCGCICNRRYFHTVFPTFICKKHLHVKVMELLCVMVCLKVFMSVLKGSKIVIYYDHSSSVTVLNYLLAEILSCNLVSQKSVFWQLVMSFRSRDGICMSVEANRVAYMLSRWDMDPGINSEFLKQDRVNFRTEI